MTSVLRRLALAAALPLLAAAGLLPDEPEPEPPAFLHLPSGEPLDLTPLPGEVPGEAVGQFLRSGRNPYREDAAAIAAGRLLYRRHCSFCHLYDGSGGNAPPLDRAEWVYATSAEDAGMFSIVYGGGFGAMRSWKRHGMTQDQVLRVIAYVRRLAVPGPEREEARRAAAMASGPGVH
ncbi:c-type cytochrome [Falsiroseomonas sp. CW058]|uniref:c-type cytochrome n=1 Tax=Falsiroseomonas sp. CW058 TaxID=3388664 RepID=UPI003D3173D7